MSPFRKVALAIKRNAAPITAPCALCGGRTDPGVGLALFLADSWGPVCVECGQYHDPELVEALYASAELDAVQARCETLAAQIAVLEARLAADAVTQD
jgi:hypothetical protein